MKYTYMHRPGNIYVGTLEDHVFTFDDVIVQIPESFAYRQLPRGRKSKEYLLDMALSEIARIKNAQGAYLCSDAVPEKYQLAR